MFTAPGKYDAQVEALFHEQDAAESCKDACSAYWGTGWRFWLEYIEIGLPAYIKERRSKYES